MLFASFWLVNDQQLQAKHVRNCSMYRIKVVLIAGRNLLPVDITLISKNNRTLFPKSTSHRVHPICHLAAVHQTLKLCLSTLFHLTPHNFVDGYCSGATYCSHFIAFLNYSYTNANKLTIEIWG
jgi:hypothetical protein